MEALNNNEPIKKFEPLNLSIEGVNNITPFKPLEMDSNIEQVDSRGLNKDEFSDRFADKQYSNVNWNKAFADKQKWYDQVGNFAVQSLGEIIGGTISGIGSIPGIAEGIVDEIKGEDANFNNAIVQIGENLKDWSKEVAPIYRENPGKSWDVNDFGWWADNAVSFASTASMLIPSYGAVKGLGYLGKVLNLTDKIGDTTKYLTKIGTGAIVSRNAENFTESLGVVNDVKSDLTDRFKSEEEFEKVKNSEVGKELAAEGREVNKENLISFISSKAGWKAYQVNSMNIIFDALQMAAVFKNPTTRIGSIGTSSEIKAAQKTVIGDLTKTSLREKAGDYLNPFVSMIGGQLSEGVEEGINYIGTLKGKNFAKELTGQKTENIDWGQLSESAFWGAFGGLANTVGTSTYGKITGEKGTQAYKDIRVNEIQNRMSFINSSVEKQKEILANPKLTDSDKKEKIDIEKQKNMFELGFNAAQAGNVDLALEQITNPNFKKKLVEMGYETEENIDKAITKSTKDILKAEKYYQRFSNNFQLLDIDEQLKANLIFQGSNLMFFQDKIGEKQNKIQTVLQDLKKNDIDFTTSQDQNLESKVQLMSLKLANQITQSQKIKNKDSYLGSLLTQRVLEFKTEINKIEEQIKDDKNIPDINLAIIQKQAELFLLSNDFKNNGQYLKDKILNQKNAKDLDKNLKDKKQKDIENSIKAYKDKIDTEVNNNKLTVEQIQSMIDMETNPETKSYLSSKLEQISKKDEAIKKDEKIDEVRQKSEEISISPVNQPDISEHPILMAFQNDLPSFKKEKINNEFLDPNSKNDIDKYIKQEDIGSLFFYLDGTDKEARKYLINKLIDLKEDYLRGDIINANPEILTNSELVFDEESYAQISNEIDKTIPKLEDSEGIDPLYNTEINTDNSIGVGAWFIFKDKDFSGNELHRKDKEGNILLSRKISKNFKALKNIKTGDSLLVLVDSKNSRYESNKNNSNEVPLKVTTIDGVFITWLPTVSGLNAKFISERNELIAIRNSIGTNPESKIQVTVSMKSDGDIINVDKWQSLKEAGIENPEFYALKPGTSDTYLSSIEEIASGEILSDKGYITTNRIDGFGSVNKFSKREIYLNPKQINRKGTVYIILKGLNGKLIPSPVIPSKLSSSQATKLHSLFQTLLKELASSNIRNRPELDEKVNKIKELIHVDKLDAGRYDDKGVKSFRYHTASKDKPARLELAYITASGEDKGKRRRVIIRETGYQILQEDNEGKWILKEDKGNSFFDFNKMAKGEEKILFQSILENKFFNIDFKRLGIDNNYKNEIIDNGYIRTNVGQVFDENNQSLGNFFGESNSFKLKITTNFNEYGLDDDEWKLLDDEEKSTVIFQMNNCK